MTRLLELALRRLESLSNNEQDAIASQILETLDDEEAWSRSFREEARGAGIGGERRAFKIN